MKTYRVGFSYTEYGTTLIKATSEADAEKKLKKHLSDSGLEDIEYRCNDRDYSAQDAEEV